MLARCADFKKLYPGSLYQLMLLAVYAICVVAVSVPMFNISQPAVAYLLLVPALVHCGLTRSRERVVDQLDFVETGIAGAVSPELLRFYLSGLFAPAMASVIVASHFILI